MKVCVCVCVCACVCVCVCVCVLSNAESFAFLIRNVEKQSTFGFPLFHGDITDKHLLSV